MGKQPDRFEQVVEKVPQKHLAFEKRMLEYCEGKP